MGEGEREVGGEGEGEGESFVGEVGVLVVRRGREVSSEVVEVGDSGLSCFKTTSILFCLLLLVLLRIASIEKQPKLLFSPIFFLEQISSSWKSTYLQLDSYLGANPFIANPSLPVRAERDSNKWSEERTSGACRCPQLYKMTRTIHLDGKSILCLFPFYVS